MLTRKKILDSKQVNKFIQNNCLLSRLFESWTVGNDKKQTDAFETWISSSSSTKVWAAREKIGFISWKIENVENHFLKKIPVVEALYLVEYLYDSGVEG